MIESKKKNLFAMIAAGLFATVSLYDIVSFLRYVQYYEAQNIILNLLSIGVPAALAVLLFLGKMDWFLLGVCAGEATVKLFNFFSSPSGYTFLMFAGAAGVCAIIFLKMRKIEIVKYLFFVPAGVMLLASVAFGPLQWTFEYGFHWVSFANFLFQQMEIAAYLMLGFWIVKLSTEKDVPAMPMEYSPAPMGYSPAVYPPEASPAQGVKYCVNCGKPNNASDSFCCQCGSQLI